MDQFEARFGQVHVLDKDSDVRSFIQSVAESKLQEDAFYVCDIGDIVRQHEEWVANLPGVQTYYAVKCNDNLTIVKVLATLGARFDCATKAEMDQVLGLGVPPSHIVYSHPTKPPSHMRHAASLGINIVTFDSKIELHKTKEFHPSAQLLLRFRCDATVSDYVFGNKFGCEADTEAKELLQLAKSLGLNVIGTCFNVGSNCKDPKVYQRGIALARGVFDCAASIGYNFTHLNIGGGFPGHMTGPATSFSGVINSALKDYFGDLNIQVMAEPGRYYVESACTLAAFIHSKKVILDEETAKPVRYKYYINDGRFGSFGVLLHYHIPFAILPHKKNSSPLFPSTVFGPTCNGEDKVVDDVMLPVQNVGDWLVMENFGAYTRAVASTFNGFQKPGLFFVVGERCWSSLKNSLPDIKVKRSFDENSLPPSTN